MVARLKHCVRLHAERVGGRLPATDLVAEELERGPHVALFLAAELHSALAGRCPRNS